MGRPPRRKRAGLAIATAVVVLLYSMPGSGRSAIAAGVGKGELSGQPVCAATAPTRVHYRPGRGLSDGGLWGLPWLAASPATSALVGHLFYYSSTPWGRERLHYARIYAGGLTPDRRVAMKILWDARKPGYGLSLLVVGAREDASGSFTENVPANTPGSNQFASGIDVPKPGCWVLTLQTGRLVGTVTLLAESP